jgi:hypothetical protein
MQRQGCGGGRAAPHCSWPCSQQTFGRGGKSRLVPVRAAAAVCARMGVGLVCFALHQKSIELKRVWWSGELGKASWRLENNGGSTQMRNRAVQVKRPGYFTNGCKWRRVRIAPGSKGDKYATPAPKHIYQIFIKWGLSWERKLPPSPIF